MQSMQKGLVKVLEFDATRDDLYPRISNDVIKPNLEQIKQNNTMLRQFAIRKEQEKIEQKAENNEEPLPKIDVAKIDF